MKPLSLYPSQSQTLITEYNKFSYVVANMIYLESPAGVGFSYSANNSFYTQVNDQKTGTLTSKSN